MRRLHDGCSVACGQGSAVVDPFHAGADGDQHEDVEDDLHAGRARLVADEAVQQRADDRRLRQQRGRVPERRREARQHVGLDQEARGLRRHAGGEEQHQHARSP